MITIRTGVFETNSSSMHSICIMKNEGYYTEKELREDLYVSKDGSISLYDLEYDRSPFRLLITFKDKLKFAIASLCGQYENYNSKEIAEIKFKGIEKIVNELIPEVKRIDLNGRMCIPFEDEDGREYYLDSNKVHSEGKIGEERYYVWDKEEGRKRYLKETNDEAAWYGDYGYIDHQSSGLLEEFLWANSITLKDFLAKRQYIVIIDGDETLEFEKLMTFGIIDKDKIAEEFHKYSS